MFRDYQKLVWRECKQCKEFMAYLILTQFFKVVGIVASVLTIRYMMIALEAEQKLFPIVAFIVFQLMLDAADVLERHFSREMLYPIQNQIRYKFCKKILCADASMFVKLSCARINHGYDKSLEIPFIMRDRVAAAMEILNIAALTLSVFVLVGPVTVFSIVIYLFGVVLIKMPYKRLSEEDALRDETKKALRQEIENMIMGFSETRVFGTQAYHYAEVERLTDQIVTVFSKRNRLLDRVNGAFSIVNSTIVVVTVLVLSFMLLGGHLAVSECAAIATLSLKLINPISNIFDLGDSISERVSGLDAYEEVMQYENVTSDTGTLTMEPLKDSIVIKDLVFAYDTTRTILNGVNMKIPKGKKIGICGESGCGKSTLIKLMERLYEPTSGNIFIDGVPINAIDRDSYVKHIGVVGQETTIFPNTILYNVKYGNFDASAQRVIEACQKAKIQDFIESLPDGFDTVVGPRGLDLSGGQRQRIALARLFLSNTDIIILDEATSALDNETETFVQDAIDALSDRTIITIAHRLSTIKNSDIIYVINSDGVISESGTHEELLNANGAYAAMVK